MNQKNFVICSCIVVALLLSAVNMNAQTITSQKTVQWHGFEKTEFLFNGLPAYYVKPSKSLTGNPWVWRAHFPDWHIEMDSMLLEKGFYIAFINTNNEYGAPKAMMVWDEFYNYLTQKLSFAHKVALEGVSRGGLYIYGWAKRNPDKISCMYAEAPVCDIKSWPGGKGKGEGDENSWKQLQEIYGFTERQAMDYNDIPINQLDGLAAFKVPVLHVISLQDKIVPPSENTFVLADNYMKLGGPITVYPMTRGKQELNGHHFEIAHPDWWADFIFNHSYPVKNPLPYEDYFEVRNGVAQFYEKIKSGQPVTVAYLGGSITYNPGWRNKLSQFFQERFPKAKFHFIAAGIPSLGSLPHAFRFRRDVLDSGKVDLLFVEAAVNDNANGTDSLTQVRSLEGIVRHAKKSNPDMDIVFFSFADPNKLQDYAEGKTPLAVHNHEMIAEHYQLPSANLAKEVYYKIQAGEFSWEDDFKDLHPAPFGQELYFETMKSLLTNCFEKADSMKKKLNAYQLPAPLDQYNFDNGSYLSVQNARIKNGWKLIPDWEPKYQVGTRDGFVHVPVLEATNPGAELTLSFTGTAIGMAIVSGPDAGIVEYSIDKKPFKKIDLYTQWSQSLYLPWYVLFEENLANKGHVLRLRIAREKNSDSKGNTCQTVYFLVNQ